jgi:hypothetical protein
MYPRTFARVKVISVSILISTVLAACGGEDARDVKDPVTEVSPNSSSLGSSAAPVNLAAKSTAFSSKPDLVAVSSSPVLTIASSKSSQAANSTTPSSQVSNSIINTVSINQTSSNNALSSKAASILALSSKAASSTALSSRAASSIALSSKSASSQAGALGATIEWRQPAARQNGDYLELSEIGGYQIRYKTSTATTFNYITIEGNSTTTYVFDKSIIGLSFEIAVYDNSGLYSDFVTIN